MNNFLVLVCQNEELKIQEFSLPLENEKVETWSGLYNVWFHEIIMEKNLFQELENGTVIVDSKNLYLSELLPQKFYLVCGIEISKLTPSQLKIPDPIIQLFQDITNLDRELSINYLEVFASSDGPDLEVILFQ